MVVNVSSYLLGGSPTPTDVSPKEAAPRLLKIVAERKTCSLADLVKMSNLPPEVCQQAAELLLSSGLVEGTPEAYRLTATGERTHLLVAG